MKIIGTILIVIFVLALALSWIYFFWKMLIDAYRNKEYGWGMFIVFFPLFGCIVYYFAKYKLRSPYDRKY